MSFTDIMHVAYKNLRIGSLRTWLTAISIAIGVSSVVLIISLTISGQNVLTTELDKLGINGLTLYSNDTVTNPLTYDDVICIEKLNDDISHVLPLVVDYGNYRIKNEQGDAVIWGIDEDIQEVMDLKLLYGRFPNKTDVRFKKNTVVIDSEMAKKIYNRANIVGKEIVITLNGYSSNFEIIGVISPQKDGINQLTGGIIPDFLYIPYTTANYMRSSNEINQIAVKCINEQSWEKAGEKVITALNRQKNLEDGYAVENLSGHVDNLKGIASFIGLLLAVIAAISLCVSGLGIMNTMLSSVSERKKEIGVCMAIGAKRKDIVMCFLAESALISAVGSSIGAIVGFLISYLIVMLLNMPLVFSLKHFLIIEVITIIVGIIFSLIPANRASKLNPITALREE